MSTGRWPSISDFSIAHLMTDAQLRFARERISRPFHGRNTFVLLDPLLEFSTIITSFEAFGPRIDWNKVPVLAHIPAAILARTFSVSFGSGKRALHWFPAEITFGSLAFLCAHVCRNAEKERRGLVLSRFHGLLRRKQLIDSEGVAAVYGMSLDDDGVIGRSNITPGPVVIAFSTANDGKSQDVVDREAFEFFAQRSALSPTPTPDTMSLYLNHGLEHGPAFRNVALDGVGAESASTYRVFFEPQQRTRYLVLFDKPLEGQLLAALLASPSAYKAFGKLVEFEALGARGTDSACFDPVRVGYLPSGMNPAPYFSILGGHYFLDPIPLAETALQASQSVTAPRSRTVRPQEQILVRNEKQATYSGKLRLKGLRLASLIAEHHPELVYRRIQLKPLHLSLCPFAKEHRSNRGKADGSLYCYDPDPEFSDYPKMKCRHQTCADRLTEDFVEALIEQGSLDPSAFQTFSEQAPLPGADFSLPQLPTDWRQHISNR